MAMTKFERDINRRYGCELCLDKKKCRLWKWDNVKLRATDCKYAAELDQFKDYKNYDIAHESDSELVIAILSGHDIGRKPVVYTRQRTTHGIPRKVMSVEDGKVYDCIQAAARDFGVAWSTINEAIDNPKRIVGGMHFTAVKNAL